MHKSCNMTISFRQRRADSKGTDSKGFGGGIEQNDRPAEGKNASRLAVRWSRLRNHSADMGRLKIDVCRQGTMSFIGPKRHFAAPNNRVAIGVTTDIDRVGGPRNGTPH